MGKQIIWECVDIFVNWLIVNDFEEVVNTVCDETLNAVIFDMKGGAKVV